MDKDCKQLPGWEQFQSKEAQQKEQAQSLGLYDPSEFNPSEQEVSLKDRLASKLDSYQQKEYGLAPVEQHLPPMYSLVGRGKGKGR